MGLFITSFVICTDTMSFICLSLSLSFSLSFSLFFSRFSLHMREKERERKKDTLLQWGVCSIVFTFFVFHIN